MQLKFITFNDICSGVMFWVSEKNQLVLVLVLVLVLDLQLVLVPDWLLMTLGSSQ